MRDAFEKKYGVDGDVLLGLIVRCLNGLEPDMRPDAEQVRKVLEKKLRDIWNPYDQWKYRRQLMVSLFVCV